MHRQRERDMYALQINDRFGHGDGVSMAILVFVYPLFESYWTPNIDRHREINR